MPFTPLFKALGHHSPSKVIVPSFIKNTNALRNALDRVGVYKPSKYLHDHFTHWLSAYAKQSPTALHGYFADKTGLNPLCKDFIQFCFKHNISLDKDKTLQSFEYHDAISDNAVKKELASFKRKEEVNLLGFGLGNGYYEKSIAQHLLEQKLAKSVKLYGFDPFAEKTEGIEFLTKNQLITNKTPKFDVITARWVLHHVALQDRWADFINSVNCSNPDALVLIVEHGFLQNNVSLFDEKLYYLLNATFDIVANIGIRPHWFTSTAPDIGANFFIHYLQSSDFDAIKNNVTVRVTQDIYEVGPCFPNQTICCMRVQP